MGETRKYRKFTHQQKLELVMASWRGERSIAELCREHDISECLLRRWRDQVLEAGAERFAAGCDSDFNVSKLYGMLPAETSREPASRTPADQTVRNVFVIGPDKKQKPILVRPIPPGATSTKCSGSSTRCNRPPSTRSRRR